MKIMAMLGARTLAADLCMFGLAACDDGFVNAGGGCKENAQAHNGMFALMNAAPAGKRNRQENWCAKWPKQSKSNEVFKQPSGSHGMG